MIHGARTVLNWCDNKDDKLSCWLKSLKQRMNGCKVVVALANKLARIVWSVLAKKTNFFFKASQRLRIDYCQLYLIILSRKISSLKI